MDIKRGQVLGIILLAIAFLTAGKTFCGADDLAKQAEKTIRSAERKMHSGKNIEADALLNEAAALISQGKAEDPNSTKILRAENKFARIRKTVDKKLGKYDGRPSSSARATPPLPQSKAMSSESSGIGQVSKTTETEKLPGGVKKRLKDITRILNRAEPYATSDAEDAGYQLRRAAELFGEIERKYGGQFDRANPDFAAVQNRFNDLTAQTARQGAAEARAAADEEAGKAAREKQSKEWIAKFSEYLSYPGQEGHNPDKLVFVPGTSEPEKFAEAKDHYRAFKAFYDKYQQTEFPNGKTWQLEDLADNEAPRRLKDFEEGFSDRIEAVSANAEKEIDAAMRQLEEDNGWKADNTIKPNLVDQRWMTAIREAADKGITALGESDPKSKELQAKLDALLAKDKENRRIRKERTFMIPDRYAGGDIDELKRKAESLVENNKKEGGDPLRCTIISENWQEETVEEWTDTSRTVWRIRTTRNITGQVAARTPDGVRLITVALAQDKQSDGSWGAIYGNLHQYSDPMLESNVNK